MGDLPTFEFSDEGLKQALEALGDTAAAVAETLQRHGFKGRRSLCGACPVANYLTAVFPGCDQADVAYAECSVTRSVVDYVDVAAERMVAESPLAVSLFIVNFDEGEFPQLDSEVSGVAA